MMEKHNIAYLHGLETMAMMERHNTSLPTRPRDHGDDGKTTRETASLREYWVRRTAGVKRIDKRRMEELREEVGVKESLTRKLVRSRLKWAGHTKSMEGERLMKTQSGGQKEKRKTVTEIGGLHEERFSGSGRGE